MPASEEFVAELRTALGHLNDPVRLETHPLAQRIVFIAQSPGVSPGQALARLLRRGISALQPAAGLAASAPEARSYQILRRHYLAGQNMTRICADLDVSERHAYRDLHRATEALAEIIMRWTETPDSANGESDGHEPASDVQREVERLASVAYQDVELDALVTDVIESAQQLADTRHITIELRQSAVNLKVAANRVVLRQAILNLSSHLVQASQEGSSLLVRVARTEDEAVVQFTYCPAVTVSELTPEQPYNIAVHLLQTQDIPWWREELGNGLESIALRLPLAAQHGVLIIDDNQGLIRLFQRYLRHQRYTVYSVETAEAASEALERYQPEAIILDIMMPDRDGWEVLQTLRRSEAGRAARIIICSIINDPQLAQVLGADAFLHKPVDQLSLLHALDEVLSRPTR